MGMEVDVEFLLNELGQTRSRPQVSRKTILGGRFGQPAQRDLLLSAGQLRRRTGRGPRPGDQTLGAAATEGGQPPPDAPGSDTEKVSNLLGR